MMWSVLLFVTLCMVLMEVIPSSQLPAEDNEMFAFQNGHLGDGPPGKRDVSFDGQSGDGPPGKRDVSDEIVNEKGRLLHGEDCWPPSLCRRR
ncbi:uncharacterized protein LOC124372220 isoform X3 [Homalodisca vitripennis]|uniref:uncharacterized protein LOC124372220 isoform X3 n=1 Tax=Homalodisca vitripennis TaxID=197043 RepID=UPI001EEB6C66|nr:uncharacterized protein LOC124372220 isoform X3 [Homalodisca vitripennis]